ncbi:MAG: UDP-glucose/GDP-mannose dehydrogenase family protein [Flavobacteriales bacterium]|nr:UDP-glucose/GDP-mannose dehydrogenase family protein [Flavobacteriales bacterium]
MNIAIVGTGYVGLVTGTCLADFGNHVYCVDIDAQKVENMKNGIVPIYEPGLEEVFHRNIKSGRLHFTTNIDEVLENCTVIFLALPTPPGEDGSADLSYVLGVASDIATKMKEYKIIVNKSTVPVGTADKVNNLVAEKTTIPFDVVSNPEFLREGYAVSDFMKPSRVIIGSSSDKAIDVMKKIYKPLTDIGIPILTMDEKSSELTKYAANSFLATKISFMNEVANYCELVGANVDDVRLGMGSDDRIGKRFLYAGIGYGGSCFPKDVKALVKSGKQENYRFKILESVEEVNHTQKTILVPEVKNYLGDLKGKKIALWGLAFKENTDDIREASSLEVIDELTKLGAEVVAYDPVASQNVQKVIGDKIKYAEGMYEALDGADVLIIATEWAEFRNPEFDIIEEKLKNKAIFDGRNLYELSELKNKGFYYKSIGRKTIK